MIATGRGFARWAALLLVLAMVAGCAGLEGDDEIQMPTVDPSETIAERSTPTLEVQATPAPTPIAWIAELTSSSATLEPPDQVFFLDGPEVGLIASDLTVEQPTRGARVRLVAGAPDGSRAAAVFLTDVGSREAEEIRLLDDEGEESEPIFGPEIVSGPAANPRITGLFWSPDGSRLAVSRDDGTLWIVAADGASESRQIVDTGEISTVIWSSGGAALAMLAHDEDTLRGWVQIVQADGPEATTIEPVYSYGAVEWLNGSGRLVVVEEWLDGPNPLAGSIFAIGPAGSGRELLVSAGEFAPRAAIPMLSGSPDGRWLAFPVLEPGPGGELHFQSLWLLELETDLLRQVEVPGSYQVTDLWWSSAGLIWRGILSGESQSYTGVEPFAVGVFDLAAGGSRIIYESDGS